MSSIIEGYNYDIFISYRQKDNKGDRWVSEFVDAFKTELESTFKEEVSVYFDINPHDGLLETHDVDASLKDKLKCLVFIPIISRTYCDPKSFAWEHEFKAFVEQASQDKFGLKVKLPNGNVASRVLPVRIHDLDNDDMKLFEGVTGSVMRTLDFVFKTISGVNRPLKAKEDHPNDNLNKTYYQDQINKVSLAIKELISALRQYGQKREELPKEGFKPLSVPQKNNKTKILAGSVILLALIILGYFLIPTLSKPKEQLETTIAVLPFRNLSNDTTQLYFCDGFMEEILNNLQAVKSFTVRSRTSSDQYRDTKKSVTTIGNELKANYLVEGSVGHEGNNLKIWVQLINSKADKHIWSKEYTREMKQIFSLQHEIAKDIATELKAVLSPDEIKRIEKKPTENLEAYNYYLQGNFYFWKSYASQDYSTAINLYEKAVELDPRFALAYSRIAIGLLHQYWFYEDRSKDVLLKSKQAIDKALEINPNLPEAHLAMGTYYYYGYLKYKEALEQIEIVLKEQPGNSEAYFVSAGIYRRSGNWEMAKSYFLKAIEIDPRSSRIALNTGETFDLLRDYSKALQYYDDAIILNPDWTYPYFLLSQLYLKLDGNTPRARELLDSKGWSNKSLTTDSLIIEMNVLINIYDGKYNEALNCLSNLKSKSFLNQWYFRPKYIYYATIYGLMNKPELEHAYYDSTRILLEKKITVMPEDPRLLSSLGIAYAGLGVGDKAITAGKNAVKFLSVSKEAYKGVYLVEDLARIYVMLGEYDNAIEEIRYLLSIPGMLSTKILKLDPRWAPLKNKPEFKKLLDNYSGE